MVWKQTQYLPLNEVRTVLSPAAVQDVEDIFYRLYDRFRSEDTVSHLMAALTAYIRLHPNPERNPAIEEVAAVVAQVIDLTHRLTRLQESEQVSQWVSTSMNWRKPL
jgi:hypothetical protein